MTEDSLLAANEAFYAAFRARRVDTMEALWSSTHPVLCIHPGNDVLHGRAKVLESWRQILRHEGAPKIVCSDVQVSVLGPMGIVTCREAAQGSPPSLLATNVFFFEDSGWRMIHHHAAPAPVVRAPDPVTLN